MFSLDIISRHGKGCAQKPQTFSKPTQDLPRSDSLSRQRSPEDGARGWETSDLEEVKDIEKTLPNMQFFLHDTQGHSCQQISYFNISLNFHGVL